MGDQGTVLILGADGFIGRHLAFGLRAAGWHVIAHARRPQRLERMGFDVLKLDLTEPKASDPDFWRERLSGVTHLVNAAGVLNASDKQFNAVHVSAPKAIYSSLPTNAAALLISAVGIDEAKTRFADYRRRGEAMAQRFDVTILRPGLVLGDTSYGGSSLLRALSALPLRMPLVGNGAQKFNPIHAQDLCMSVAQLLIAPKPGDAMDIGGPEVVTQHGMMQAYRGWLGLRPVAPLRLSRRVCNLMGRIGDAMRLGPISRTAVSQLDAGVLAQTHPHIATLSTPPRGFHDFLAARPAGTQDLWHARLYLMRPVLRIVLALLWLASGILGLTLHPDSFLPMVTTSAVPDAVLIAMARLGGIIDLALAFALLRGWRPKLTAVFQLLMVAGYTLAFTALAPALWLLPLGGLLKNIPILALIGLSAILEDER